MDLYTETVRLLQKSRGKFRQIAEETGLDYFWLSSVSQGRIEDPGVRKMQKLYDYLINLDVERSA